MSGRDAMQNIGRCADCRFWTPAQWSFREIPGKRDLFRVCARASVEGAPMFIDVEDAIGRDDDAKTQLVTAADFGCVQFERKESNGDRQ